jgi:DNA-binding MarR family transcriptional regulator
LNKYIAPYKQKAAEMGRACMCFNIRKTTRGLTAHYDRIISPSGLKATQLSLLMTVLLQEKANLTQLANMLGMDRTTLSRNIRLLEQKGMITVSSGADRREQCIDLTDKGREAVNLAIPLWEKAQAEVVDRFGEEWVQGFLTNLRQLNKIM